MEDVGSKAVDEAAAAAAAAPKGKGKRGAKAGGKRKAAEAAGGEAKKAKEDIVAVSGERGRERARWARWAALQHDA